MIIAFGDYDDDFIDFPKDLSVMKVIFPDLSPHSIPETDYGKVLPEAKEIAAFVNKSVKADKNIICQCEYGISRSSGLAAAIMEHYKKEGIKVFSDYRYMPNKFVFNKVLAQLRILKRKEMGLI